MADLSHLLAEKLDLDNAPGGASSSSSSSSTSTAAPLPLKLTDLPNQVLVSIFVVAADDDLRWALFTVPLFARPSATSTARATLRRSTTFSFSTLRNKPPKRARRPRTDLFVASLSSVPRESSPGLARMPIRCAH
jgi:hypothetical protein